MAQAIEVVTQEMLAKLDEKIPYRWRVNTFYEYVDKQGNSCHPKDDGAKPTMAGCIGYIDARDVDDMLDAAVGKANWKNEFKMVKDTMVCRISIRINEEWVYKEDGADASSYEAKKGELSNAKKRAGVPWGIGRFIYDEPMIYVLLNKYGKPMKLDKATTIWDLDKYCNELIEKKQVESHGSIYAVKGVLSGKKQPPPAEQNTKRKTENKTTTQTTSQPPADTSKFSRDLELDFGKHKGIKLRDVDPSYLEWLRDKANKPPWTAFAKEELTQRTFPASKQAEKQEEIVKKATENVPAAGQPADFNKTDAGIQQMKERIASKTIQMSDDEYISAAAVEQFANITSRNDITWDELNLEYERLRSVEAVQIARKTYEFEKGKVNEYFKFIKNSTSADALKELQKQMSDLTGVPFPTKEN